MARHHGEQPRAHASVESQADSCVGTDALGFMPPYSVDPASNGVVLNDVGLGNVPMEFTTTPPMLLDTQFMEMERVISFDDGMFAAIMESGAANSGW